VWFGYTAFIIDAFAGRIVGRQCSLVADLPWWAARPRLDFRVSNRRRLTAHRGALWRDSHVSRTDPLDRHRRRLDNAVAKSFLATCKKELIYTRPWSNLTDARQQTFL
jgi:hypothetical protein